MVMARRLAAMSYTYTSWLRSPAIVITQFTSTRPTTEGSLGVDKSRIVVESIVAKSESRTGLPTIVAEWRTKHGGSELGSALRPWQDEPTTEWTSELRTPDRLEGTVHNK
jgi:hypothetical protein